MMKLQMLDDTYFKIMFAYLDLNLSIRIEPQLFPTY